MVDLVNVRATKGKRKQFLVDKRLVEKYPDDYEVVEEKKPAAKKTTATSEPAVNVEATKK